MKHHRGAFRSSETNHSYTGNGGGERRCGARGSVGGKENGRREGGWGGEGEVKHTGEACPSIALAAAIAGSG